jgi:hypothetical protein
MPLEVAGRETDTRIEDVYPTQKVDRKSWFERQDPTVWSDWTPGAPLSPEDTARYDREGFLILEHLLSIEDIAVRQIGGAELRGHGTRLARRAGSSRCKRRFPTPGHRTSIRAPRSGTSSSCGSPRTLTSRLPRCRR